MDIAGPPGSSEPVPRNESDATHECSLHARSVLSPTLIEPAAFGSVRGNTAVEDRVEPLRAVYEAASLLSPEEFYVRNDQARGVEAVDYAKGLASLPGRCQPSYRLGDRAPPRLGSSPGHGPGLTDGFLHDGGS